MSLWVRCDICLEGFMHPSMKERNEKHYSSEEGWLFMENFDICPSCKKKFNIKRKNGVRNFVKKIVENNGIGV